MRMLFLFKHKIWLLPLICFAFYSCNSKDEYGFSSERWSSSEPLNFNYRIRKEKYLEGNLVANASFEQGKIKSISKNLVSTKIDGWEIIGESVKWVNVKSKSAGYQPDEVHSGTHSIKIERHKADETESMGEGVISDFIRVIPGSYRLSMYINLRNIKNPKTRLGTKIYDAVNIQLMYYDRNKLQINGDVRPAPYKIKINSTFKGFSFSNFDQIDSTGWLHIIGRTDVFPFPDGDLPDETKFVRVFIGLKGTGTLWADDVNLRFTSRNLTLFEKMHNYFDSTFEKNQLITPHPQKITIQESKIYYRPFYSKSFPLILIPRNPDPATLMAAKKLEKKIRGLIISLANVDSSAIPNLIQRGKYSKNSSNSIVFSLGKTPLFEKNMGNLPVNAIVKHNEGYIIYTLPDSPNIIFIYGNTPTGEYYAIQTVLQLFDNKRFLFHDANIIDYPSFDHRALLLADFDPKVLTSFLSQNDNRFDEIYLPGEKMSTKQFLTSRWSTMPIKKNVYFTWKNGKPTVSSDRYRHIIHNNVTKINTVAWLFNPELDIIPDTTNFLKNYVNHTHFSFPGSTIADEIVFVKNLNIPVQVLPLFGNNFSFTEGITQQLNNYKQLAWLKNNGISLCYNGYGIRSLQIDEADYYAMNKMYGQHPIFFDYTMYPGSKYWGYFANDPYYPQKLQTACLFEPYSNTVVKEVFKDSPENVLVYRASDIFQQIQLKTASDYFWNPDKYDPDLSLYRALISKFGTKYSMELIHFNDLYFKLKSEIIQVRNAKYKYKHTRKIALYLKDIKGSLTKLRSFKTSNCKEANIILSSLVSGIENSSNNPSK